MEINILVIDDDKKICEQIQELLNDEHLNDNVLKIEYKNDFESGLAALKDREYDLVILDLYKGQPSEDNPEKPGQKIYDEIRNSCFIPIIFFSGLIKELEPYCSEIVRVVRKGDGLEPLKKEIQYILDSKLLLVKQKLIGYINESMRLYMWDYVHKDWNNLKEIKDEVSLSYLLVRQLSNSFAREDIIKLLGDVPDKKMEKAHPMEFYLYPPNSDRYETGVILIQDKSYYIILTPTCDFIERNGKTKCENVLLAHAYPLNETEEYISYKGDSGKNNTEAIKKIIENRGSDRFYFLPKTFFIPNLKIDFQNIFSMPKAELKKFDIVTKLDNPFSQSMIATFIRYYTRIGQDDIDSNYILKYLDK